MFANSQFSHGILFVPHSVVILPSAGRKKNRQANWIMQEQIETLLVL